MNSKHEIISSLRRYALLTDLLGEDAFRARAFDGAARSLETSPDSLEILLENGRLEAVKGIGKSVAAAIRELHSTGTFGDLQRAVSEVPAGVIQLMRVDGLGPKKARTLWKDASIESLSALESEILAGNVQKLPGFGSKTAEKFLSSIAFLRLCNGRHLRHHAIRTAELMRERLQSMAGVKEIYFGGSLSRGMETVRDLDVLIVANPSDHHSIEQALLRESAFTWIRTEKPVWQGTFAEFEIEVDICSPETFGPRKLIITGSKSHYSALKECAASRGFVLDADALRSADGRAIPTESDFDIYRRLGLEPVPAARRETDQTLVPAGSTRWPQPVTVEDFRGILHNHTTWSDGKQSLREMAEHMIAAGYEFIGIADHSKAAAYANGLSAERVREQWREIDQLNLEFAPFRILKGTECDILPDGSLDFTDDLLAQFDFVVASIHSGFSMTEDEATRRLCRAIENPHVDILGHPTGRLLLERPGYSIDHLRVIECAAKHGKAIELNANPHRLDLDWRWLGTCNAAGVPVPINPDAHDTAGLSDIRYGVDVAAKGPLPAESCPSCWSADRVVEWCNSHR